MILSDTWVNYLKKQLEELKVVASGEQDRNGGNNRPVGLSVSMPFYKSYQKTCSAKISSNVNVLPNHSTIT